MSAVQNTKMRTRSGEPISYLQPWLTEVRWSDLQAGTTRQRRYAGQLDWTIAEHLALCAYLAKYRGLSPRERALCAAHDLHEAYVMDLPSGLKDVLPEFKARVEIPWETHVMDSLGFTPGMTEQEFQVVKGVDLRALAVEMSGLGWERWPPAMEVIERTGGSPDVIEVSYFQRVREMCGPLAFAKVRSVITDAGFGLLINE